MVRRMFNGASPCALALVLACTMPVALAACGDDDGDKATADSGGAAAAVKAAQPLVDKATAEVTKWTGPAEGPTAPKGDKSLVGIMNLGTDVGASKWCGGAKEAAKALGWDFTLLDGKGSVAGQQAAIQQAIARQPDAVLLCSVDGEAMKSTIADGTKRNIVFVGVHSTALPGPAPDLGLFTNVSGDGRDIGKASGAYTVVKSKGTAHVVALGDKSYAISRIKSRNTLDEVARCKTCKALDDDSLPVGDAPQRTPDRFSSYLERYGTPLWIYSVTDFYLDSGVPAFRSGGIPPEGQVFMIGSDGSPAAYERIRKGEYQLATVPEPLFEEGWQMVDEVVRALAGEKPSGYEPAVHIIDSANIDRDVTDENVYDPHNDYREHYVELWKTGKTESD
jgi:ribose transport system substrate-binding protein